MMILAERDIASRESQQSAEEEKETAEEALQRGEETHKQTAGDRRQDETDRQTERGGGARTHRCTDARTDRQSERKKLGARGRPRCRCGWW